MRSGLASASAVREPEACCSEDLDEIAEKNGSMTRLDYALYQVGVQQRLVVLYMPDYVTQQTRLSQSSAAWLGMGRMLPEYDITLPLCPGPFTDDQGHAAFF